MEENEYTIYGLKDPTNNEIKLISFTINLDSRYKKHLYVEKGWISELKKTGMRPEIVIFDTIKTSDRNIAHNKMIDIRNNYEFEIKSV